MTRRPNRVPLHRRRRIPRSRTSSSTTRAASRADVVIRLHRRRQFGARIKEFDKFAVVVESERRRPPDLQARDRHASNRTEAIANYFPARAVLSLRPFAARHPHRPRQRRVRRAAGRRRLRRRGQRHSRQHRRAVGWGCRTCGRWVWASRWRSAAAPEPPAAGASDGWPKRRPARTRSPATGR